MPEIAVITGDIINSRAYNASRWMESLKAFLGNFGESPMDWEIYRGDEFQLRTRPRDALKTAFQLKALIRQVKGLDVRIAIGLGNENFRGSRVGESNGSAYQRSGKAFESLKHEKKNLLLKCGKEGEDRTLNLILALAMDFMDEWSPVSAEVISLALARPDASQEALAGELNINQSAVSQRLKRAKKDLVEEVLAYYSNTFKNEAP